MNFLNSLSNPNDFVSTSYPPNFILAFTRTQNTMYFVDGSNSIINDISGGQFSIECIMYLLGGNPGTVTQGLVSNIDSTKTSSGINIGLEYASSLYKLRCRFSTGSQGSNTLVSVATLPTSRWYHIVFYVNKTGGTSGNGVCRMYINGNQENSAESANIGAAAYNSGFFSINNQNGNGVTSNPSGMVIYQARLNVGSKYSSGASFTPPKSLSYEPGITLSLINCNNAGTNVIDSGPYNLAVTGLNTVPTPISQLSSPGVVYV